MSQEPGVCRESIFIPLGLAQGSWALAPACSVLDDSSLSGLFIITVAQQSEEKDFSSNRNTGGASNA